MDVLDEGIDRFFFQSGFSISVWANWMTKKQSWIHKVMVLSMAALLPFRLAA